MRPAPISSLTDLCTQAASSVEIQEPARWEPVEADKGYAGELNRITSRLNRRVAGETRRLRGAGTSGGQARAAASLAASYGAAATGVRKLPTPQRTRSANAGLARALAAARRAYLSLKRAASRESAGAYRRAQRQVAGSQRGLQRSYSELRPLGYRPER